jgi:hypothetical protein
MSLQGESDAQICKYNWKSLSRFRSKRCRMKDKFLQPLGRSWMLSAKVKVLIESIRLRWGRFGLLDQPPIGVKLSR